MGRTCFVQHNAARARALSRYVYVYVHSRPPKHEGLYRYGGVADTTHTTQAVNRPNVGEEEAPSQLQC